MSNVLALGTAQFGMSYGISNKTGKVSDNNAFAILEMAERLDIDTIDTAIGYGDSEACLGQYGVSTFKVITKLHSVPDEIKDVNNWVKDNLQRSLERLKIEKLHGLLLHEPDFLCTARGEELWLAIQNLKSQGLIQKIGISIYSPKTLDALNDSFSFDIIQAPLNILDCRLLTSGWLDKLYKDDIEVHARSAFLQGLLLFNTSDRPDKFNSWKSIFESWDKWLAENKIDPVHACIAFLASQSGIKKIIVGVENSDQLESINSYLHSPVFESFPSLSTDDENLINPSRWGIN
jgi:aryl-alcohol dehydrogenase-like predicted oxidoreductase